MIVLVGEVLYDILIDFGVPMKLVRLVKMRWKKPTVKLK